MAFEKHAYLSTGFLHRIQVLLFVINILIILSILSGCTMSSSPAPITVRSQPPSTQLLNHRVAAGETLYSIAWRYGLDYQAVAKRNNIKPPYKIFTNKIIWLDNKIKQEKKAIYTKSLPQHSRLSALKKSQFRVKSKQKKIKNKKSGGTLQQIPVSIHRPKKKPIFVKQVSTNVFAKLDVQWFWPSDGVVLTNFSGGDGLKRGIDIKGKKGDSVNAAASGEVVYAGSGLRGYGKLLIIKHNSIYLSAYAHNHVLYVQEGDDVKAGQRIAEIGSTGTGAKTPKLHFQIRKEGKPINPLTVLPSRRL